jgi:MYXO-CTERM domain-containing protein
MGAALGTRREDRKRMNKPTCWLGLAGALVAGGCLAAEDTTSSNQGLTFEEFKATAKVDAERGFYIIDGDWVVRDDKELYEIWSRMIEGGLAVYNEGGVDHKWNDTQKMQLTYCISNAFNANKQTVITAMQGAAEGGWEMFAQVDFTYVAAQDGNCTNANNAVMFNVVPVNSGGQYLAAAFFPNYSRVDRVLNIDNSAFNGGAGNIPLRNIMAHELGHALGFRHEHTRPEAAAGGCIEDNSFRGLTPYDSASVMHYPQCGGTSTDLSFTTLDQQGVIALYGARQGGGNQPPMNQINYPTPNAMVPPSFTVLAQIVDTDIQQVDLYIDGTLRDTATAAPWEFDVVNLSVGAHNLEIRATDVAQQTTTASVSFTVTSGGGNNPPPPGGGGNNPDNPDYVTGGCSTGSPDGSLLVVLGLGLALMIRRRR